MFPNFNAEYARKGFTLEKLAEEMEKRGCKRTVPTLSLKLNGKLPLSLREAKMLKECLETDLSIEHLFEEVGECE